MSSKKFFHANLMTFCVRQFNWCFFVFKYSNNSETRPSLMGDNTIQNKHEIGFHGVTLLSAIMCHHGVLVFFFLSHFLNMYFLSKTGIGVICNIFICKPGDSKVKRFRNFWYNVHWFCFKKSFYNNFC